MRTRNPDDDGVGRTEEVARSTFDESLEATRAYLLKIATNEINLRLRAKEGPSDLVQETLLEAYRDAAQFRGESPEELRGWLRGILIHNIDRVAQYYRAQKRHIAREVPGSVHAIDGYAAELVADCPSPSEQVIRNEFASILSALLEQLPDRDRELLIWRNEGCTFEEMGRRAGYSTAAAHKNWLKALGRARHKLARLTDR
jgi:RNA polymerase sigma-70 factor (ECF subfamily)